MNRMFLVTQWREGKQPEIQGLFATEVEDLDACVLDTFCIIPMEVGKRLPVENAGDAIGWYPLRQDRPAEYSAIAEYGITLAELRERIDAIQRGEGIPHHEAVARIRRSIAPPSAQPETEVTADQARNVLDDAMQEMPNGYEDGMSIGVAVEQVYDDHRTPD